MTSRKNYIPNPLHFLAIFVYSTIIIFITTFCSEDSPTNQPNPSSPENGKIICLTQPVGANIYFNGENTGKTTPDSLIDLKTGNYNISLNLTGYIGWSSNVRIDSNETKVLDEILEEDINYWWTAYNLFDLNISDRHVFCIIADHNNVKWMGIGNTGLVKFDDSTWTIINDIMPGYSPGFIVSIDIDAYNNIWMGTYGSGLCKFDGITNWTYYRPDNSNIPGYRVLINRTDINNNQWLLIHDGTGYQQYISLFDGTNFTIYDSTNTPLDLLNKEIRDICCLENGVILVSSAENGIYEFNGFDWIEDNTVNDIRAIFKDSNGLIWLVDKDGQIFSGEFTNWEYITTISNGSYRTIMVDSNIIWVGSYASGVSKFDGEMWTNYDGVVQSLLDGDDVEQIKIDRIGNKWIATTRGVLRRK